MKDYDKWLKAAVIGSLWGASEIVLGSFLHNLRIPFSGNLLTAIGIILMVAGHRLWPEKGVIFRAGLICAALKTMSPSPVILGPMLAIFMQASLMELSILAGRRSTLGYLIGGGLAVSWNLAYRILSSIILYGSSLITLYQNLVDFLAQQIGWEIPGYWSPILLLWVLFFGWGVTAAVLGIMISRAAERTKEPWHLQSRVAPVKAPRWEGQGSRWHLLRPLLILALLITGLYSINMLPALYSLAALLCFLGLSSWYNPGLILRFARKRGFWMAITIMILLSGLFMGQDHGFSREGFQVGLSMAMRAIYVITGFGIISSELQRPQIAALFSSKRMEAFMAAVKTAFHTTPLLMENIPGKKAWRQPVRVLTSMVGSMEYSLEYMRDQHFKRQAVFVVTGDKGQGKTSLVKKLVDKLKKRNLSPAGILAPGIVKDGKRVGYRVQDIRSGRESLLCERLEGTNQLPYLFHPNGIRHGEEALKPEHAAKADLLIVDEVGPFELQGKGWDKTLQKLLPVWDGPILLVVRTSLVDAVARHYKLRPTMVFTAGKTPVEEALEAILTTLQQDTPDTGS